MNSSGMQFNDSVDETMHGDDESRRQSMQNVYENSLNFDAMLQGQHMMHNANMASMHAHSQPTNQFMFPQMMHQFPTINTDVNMTGPYGPYSSVGQDAMGTLISPQFANMGMGNTYSPTTDTPTMPTQFSPAHNTAPTQQSFQQQSRTTPNSAASADATRSSSSVSTNTSNSTPGASQTAASEPKNSVSRNESSTSSDVEVTTQDVTSGESGRASASASVVSGSQDRSSSTALTQPTASAGAAPKAQVNPAETRGKSIYSRSGFDMIKALWLVATRKNPQIHLGAVDMSCAFVVCDVTMNDCPIIYVSDNFQNLTGYSRHEIVGQNCRFLQSPTGKVEVGSKREFVDNSAVFNLKNMIEERKEVQQSLINYRKGGKPFLNLLTMIPIPWDTDEIRYFIGFQIDLVECPDAIGASEEFGGHSINYKHSDIGQYIWTPPNSTYWDGDNGQTLSADDVSTLLQQFNPKSAVSDWHKQSWDKMLLENTDDFVHVLSLKGLFLYVSPACKRLLEYDSNELVGNSLSSICHPSDIVPVTRELKEATAGTEVDIVFRIRRKSSGYTWFESHGSIFNEAGKGRKCIILVGRKRPVFALNRLNLDAHGGIGNSETWSKMSTSGMFLFVSASIRSLLDLQPKELVGTSIQELMRKDSRADFGRALEKARRGKIVTCKHEMLNRRGQGLQAQTVLYPGDAGDGEKPSFLLAQTKLLKASSRAFQAPENASSTTTSMQDNDTSMQADADIPTTVAVSEPAGGKLVPGNQDAALASEDNIFDELRTTKCSSWQFELRQMEKINRILAEELVGLLTNKKKRKRRKGVGIVVKDCANCHTSNTPEWRRGPSGQRDLCNSCGLRYAKQVGRVSPRNSRNGNGDSSSKKSASPNHSSPLHREISSTSPNRLSGGGATGSSNIMGQKSATSVHNQNPGSQMPPPSQSSGAVAGAGMTSIREEHESHRR